MFLIHGIVGKVKWVNTIAKAKHLITAIITIRGPMGYADSLLSSSPALSLG